MVSHESHRARRRGGRRGTKRVVRCLRFPNHPGAIGLRGGVHRVTVHRPVDALMGARKPGQARVSGERCERNLDPVEHARTLLGGASRSWPKMLMSRLREESQTRKAGRGRLRAIPPQALAADFNRANSPL